MPQDYHIWPRKVVRIQQHSKQELEKILEWKEENNVKILILFVKETSNVLADCLSRHNEIIYIEWTPTGVYAIFYGSFGVAQQWIFLLQD